MNASDKIDMEALKRTLDPYILPSLLRDKSRLRRIRRYLAERGVLYLLPEETRTGMGSPPIYLKDVR